MNILMVCEGINESSIIAQPWKHVYELARRLIGYGNKVKILTNMKEGIAREEQSFWHKLEDIPIIRVKKKIFFDDEQLLKHLNDEQVDVINWHGSDIWSTIQIYRIKEKLRNNVVWTLHSGPLYINDIKNLRLTELFALHKFWNNILNAACPSFIAKKWMSTLQLKFVITLSQRLKAHLVKNGIRKDDEIKVIRSGLDVEKYSPLNARKLFNKNEREFLKGYPKNHKLILYFGPLSVFRGVDTLLKAMPEIIKKNPSVKLLLLARGFLQSKEEKKLAKMALRTKNVILVKGFLTEDMLISYLSLADLVVLPFRFWPQVECPLTILEAMSMEKSTITTNVGAIHEIIRHEKNGILVPPNDHKLLGRTVARLLNDKELAVRIGKSARRYVKEFHDWNIIVKRTMEAFSDAVSQMNF